METKEKFKSRKLLICIALFITSTVFLALETATFGEWSDFNMWNFGIYAGGNIGEHYTKRDEKG